MGKINEEGFRALKEAGREMRAFDTEKTEVAEVDRSVYDVKDAARRRLRGLAAGLTPEIVEQHLRGEARPGVDAACSA